jgi:hypothetical protein
LRALCIGVDEWECEDVPKRLRPDVLLAATVIDRARRGIRVVEAQVMTASADRLWLGRLAWWLVLGLRKLALGRKDREPTPVVLLETAAEYRRQNEDKPPVALDETGDVVHVKYLPAFARARATSAGDAKLAIASAAEERHPFRLREDQHRSARLT